jgi:hypothetical protein
LIRGKTESNYLLLSSSRRCEALWEATKNLRCIFSASTGPDVQKLRVDEHDNNPRFAENSQAEN